MNAPGENKIPALIVAGTGSGVGKTSVTLGLIKALVARGLQVQPFKVGPDYLDPTWLTAAAGRRCYNLDGWMTDREYVTRDIFARQCAGADIAIVEGVMGLFDGASPDALTGSTAEIALWLDLPVLLVVDVGGAARSAAAMVAGFANFEAGVRLAGVVANRCGSAGHAQLVARALEHAGQPALAGWLAKNSLPALPDRHLGLHAAHAQANSAELLAELGRVCGEQLDLDGILESAGGDSGGLFANANSADIMNPHPDEKIEAHPNSNESPESQTIAKPVRLAVARDAAFYFYYPDNLSLLADAGAELVEFSPLNDTELPRDIDAVYIGGGYPEEFAATLAANTEMRAALCAFAQAGGLVYGECGGFMYLCESLETLPESRASREAPGDTSTGDASAGPERHAMLGLLPLRTRMLPRRRMLGYVETTCTTDTWFGAAGSKLRGHEFHYSEIVAAPEPEAKAKAESQSDANLAGGAVDPFEKIKTHEKIEAVFELRGRRNSAPRAEGFRNAAGTVLGSYVHQHFGSRPAAAADFVAAITQSRRRRRNSGREANASAAGVGGDARMAEEAAQ